MKKLYIFLLAFAATAALCAGFVACNEPQGQEQDPNENKVQPVKVSDGVAENLWQIARIIKVPSDGHEGQYFNGCVMINSVDELPQIDTQGNPLELPAINFDSHTLIVGQCVLGNSGVFLASQNLVVEDALVTMNLILEQKEGIHDQKLELSRFWGLYPKITAETICTNVINKK